MADIKTKYPSTSSVNVVITLASLAASSTLLVGNESNAVDNTTTLDLDHLVSGTITTGTSPTAGNIEIWAYAPMRTTAGVPLYPYPLDGTASAETFTALLPKDGVMKLITSIQTNSTSDATYSFAPVSIASLFGAMPKFWGVFVTHNTVSALNGSAPNHFIDFERIQAQTV